jgi:hypothetical protein
MLWMRSLHPYWERKPEGWKTPIVRRVLSHAIRVRAWLMASQWHAPSEIEWCWPIDRLNRSCR